MDALELSYAIMTIKSNPEHHNQRRVFHENFEWLEHYWRSKYGNNENSFQRFITKKGEFYWNIDEVRVLAQRFASIECIGSNEDPGYAQTGAIAQATMYLRYFCRLFDVDIPTCESINCRKHKIEKGICNIETGRQWKGSFDPIFAFKALMFIIRQVRNNLFHGHKVSLEHDQFERDKVLVEISCEVTEIILAYLIDSERS